MERKIGEVFNDGPTKLEVAEQNGCECCFYSDFRMCLDKLSSEIRGECSPMDREDYASVIFKEVKT